MATPLKQSTSRTHGGFQPFSKDDKEREREQQRLPASITTGAARREVMPHSAGPGLLAPQERQSHRLYGSLPVSMLSASARSYCYDEDPVGSALLKGKVELALSQAAYMGAASCKRKHFTGNYIAQQQQSHASLITFCTQQPEEGEGATFGVPLALNLINPRLLDSGSLECIQSMKAFLCQDEGVAGSETLSAEFKDIQTLAEQAPLETLHKISEVYRIWRPVLPTQMLTQMAEAYRQVLPAVLAECETIMAEDPLEAEIYFQSFVIQHLELLGLGSSAGECRDVKNKVGALAYKVFHKKLSLVADETVHRSFTVEDILLAKHCENLGLIYAKDTKVLNKLILRKSVMGTSVKEASKLEDKFIRLLENGHNQEMLEFYCQYAEENPDLLAVRNPSNLHRYMKRALRGELACLCFQIGHEGVTRKNVERIQVIIGQLGRWVEMPWVIGMEPCATLNALRHLVSECFLAPLWEKACDTRNLAELERLQQDYEVFIYDDFYDQFESLQRQNESLEQENESLQQENKSLQQENESLQQENMSLQQENESLQQENESLQPQNESPQQKQSEAEVSPGISSASPSEGAAYLEPTEENLKLLLSSSDRLEQFKLFIHENEENLEKESRQWLALMTGMYQRGKFTNQSTSGAMATKQIMWEVIPLVVRCDTARINAVPEDKKRQTCKEMADDVMNMVLLINKFDIALSGDDYYGLKYIVRKHYLRPLLLEAKYLRKDSGEEKKWGALTEVYSMSRILKKNDRKLARKIYVRLYPVPSHQIKHDLGTGSAQTIRKTLKHIQTKILERHYFYGNQDVEDEYSEAESVVCFALKRLQELVKKNREIWLPVQEQFLEKCRDTDFLKLIT